MVCGYCGKTLPPGAHRNKKYCNRTCRELSYQQRRKMRQESAQPVYIQPVLF